jgi:hypothetical protein
LIPAFRKELPRDTEEGVFGASREPAELALMRSQPSTMMRMLHGEARMRMLCSSASEILGKGREE